MQKNSLGELSKHLQEEIPRENVEKVYEEYSGKIPDNIFGNFGGTSKEVLEEV